MMAQFSSDSLVDAPRWGMRIALSTLSNSSVGKSVTYSRSFFSARTRFTSSVLTKESRAKLSRTALFFMAVGQVMNYLEHGIIENSVNFPTCTPGQKITASRICVLNKNVPSMLGKLTGILAEMNVNISKLINKSKGDNAYTLIDIDGDIDENKIKDAFSFEGIISVRVI